METADVPSALQERLGSGATAGLLDVFETARQEWTANVMTVAVERFERRLAEESANWREKLGEEAAHWRVALAQTEAALRLEMRDGFARLRQENLSGRFELLKWCFVFWIGQMFAMTGALAVLLRVMRL